VTSSLLLFFFSRWCLPFPTIPSRLHSFLFCIFVPCVPTRLQTLPLPPSAFSRRLIRRPRFYFCLP